MYMKRFISILLLIVVLAASGSAQTRKPQNKPYIDLRPLHFGVHVGLNLQDVEFANVGPQIIQMPTGEQKYACVVADADKWNPGFSVGVLADMRLSNHFSLRLSPAMHFGSKRLKFLNLLEMDENGRPLEETQDLKNTYISAPLDLKFAAERFNNYRPYIMAGINPLINLSGKDQDYVQLKRFDFMIELGLGCDFYLPFFKLIPELKFCYSLTDALDKGHWDEIIDANRLSYAKSISGAHAKMIVLTLHFE